MMTLQSRAQGKLARGFLKNSAWGIGANILQLVFLSVFFAILARKLTTQDFGYFLIATTIYQIFSACASMGLGQWFIRKYITEVDKLSLTSKFLKTQFALGFLFYLVNLLFAYGLYSDPQIQLLSLVLGINIVFENFINAIKSLNIVEGRQDKTAKIMVFDGLLKLIVGVLFFISPFSVITLAIVMVVSRVLTLGLFLKIGSSSTLQLKLISRTQLSFKDLKILIFKNWRFMVIGSISILYWRVGNIIISKMLPLADVAEYELSFRIFSIFLILPVIVSATLYPELIKLVAEKKEVALRHLYQLLFFVYMAGAMLSYGFIFSFSDVITTVAFGDQYPHVAISMQEMFLAFLVMPTVLLQANLIVALGLENKDMIFNVFSLLLNVVTCLVGLYFFKSLSVANYAIFFSLVIFHVLQDFVLVKKRMLTILHCLFFYSLIAGTILIFQFLPKFISIYYLYAIFSMLIIGISVVVGLSHKNIISTVMRKIKRQEERC